MIMNSTPRKASGGGGRNGQRRFERDVWRRNPHIFVL